METIQSLTTSYVTWKCSCGARIGVEYKGMATELFKHLLCGATFRVRWNNWNAHVEAESKSGCEAGDRFPRRTINEIGGNNATSTKPGLK